MFHEHGRSTPGERANPARRAIAAAVAAAVLTPLALLAAATPAAAADRVGPGIEVPGILGWGNQWLGAIAGTGQATADGEPSFCISAGLPAPEGMSYSSIERLVDPQLAYVLWKHQDEQDATSRAAISYLAHTRHETGTSGVSAADRIAAFESATPQYIKDRASQYLAEASGSSSALAAPATPVATTTRTGNIHDLGVQYSSGAWVPGVTITVTLSGPAVFDLNGNKRADPGETNVWTGTTPAGPLTLLWVATGDGPVTYSRKVSGLPRTSVTQLDAGSAIQHTITNGLRFSADPESIETTSPQPVATAQVDFQPSATTATPAKVVAVGAALTDRVTVSSSSGTWVTAPEGGFVPVTFEGTAYSTGTLPPTAPGSVPSGAPVLGTTSFTATGPGTYTASIPGVGTGQVVTWVWRMVKSHQPVQYQEFIRGDWSDSYGQPNESTSVRHNTVAVSSAASRTDARYLAQQAATQPPAAPAGDNPTADPSASPDPSPSAEPVTDPTPAPTPSTLGELVDDVTVTGFPDDHPTFTGGYGIGADVQTMTSTLLFFGSGQAVTDANRSAARVIASTTVPAANGSVRVDAADLLLVRDASGYPVAGTYVFVTDFAGDDRVAPFHSSVQDTAEQVSVTPTPMSLSSVALNGTPADPPGAGGNDPGGTGPAAPAAAGRARTFVAASPEAAPGEDPPTEVSSVGDLVDASPAQLGDVARVLGTIDPGTTLVFDLYHWLGDTPVCDQASLVAHLDPVIVDLAGDYGSDLVDVPYLHAGSYGFVATVLAADGAVLSTGTCGEPTETLAVAARPVVLTTTAHRLAASAPVPSATPSADPSATPTADPTPSDSPTATPAPTATPTPSAPPAIDDTALVDADAARLGDAAHVVGTLFAGYTLEFDLYHWLGAIPSCTADHLVQHVPAAPLTDEGDNWSPAIDVPYLHAGSYGWIATVRDASGHILQRGACGAASETLTVASRAVQLTTTMKSGGAFIASRPADVTDQATVTGTLFEGTTISFALYHWLGAPTCTAANLAWQSERLPLTDEGLVTSPSAHLRSLAKGSYGFIATVRSADGTVMTAGTCGESDETLAVDASRGAASARLGSTGTDDVGPLGLLALSLGGLGTLMVLYTRRHWRRVRGTGCAR